MELEFGQIRFVRLDLEEKQSVHTVTARIKWPFVCNYANCRKSKRNGHIPVKYSFGAFLAKNYFTLNCSKFLITNDVRQFALLQASGHFILVITVVDNIRERQKIRSSIY